MSREYSRRDAIRGAVHRKTMRIIHRFGLCYPQSVAVEEGQVWCHWCGMRGRVTTPAMMQRAEAELRARFHVESDA